MSQLEKKILKGVYSFETKQTLTDLLLRLISIISFTLGGLMLIVFILEELAQQQTMDVFEIFSEDIETIRENFLEVIGTFFQEAPKGEILIALLTIILAIVLILKIMLNFARVKNKLKSLIKYWFTL